jgi:hypothetical protein
VVFYAGPAFFGPRPNNLFTRFVAGMSVMRANQGDAHALKMILGMMRALIMAYAVANL